MEQLDEYNYGARAYSIRALAAIADPCALDVLVTAAATDFAPSVRRAAAKDLEPCTGACWMQISAPPLKPKPKRRCSVSPKTRLVDSYAAVVGLQALSTMPDLKGQIQAQFEQMARTDPDTAVRARVSLAQQLFHI